MSSLSLACLASSKSQRLLKRLTERALLAGLDLAVQNRKVKASAAAASGLHLHSNDCCLLYMDYAIKTPLSKLVCARFHGTVQIDASPIAEYKSTESSGSCYDSGPKSPSKVKLLGLKDVIKALK